MTWARLEPDRWTALVCLGLVVALGLIVMCSLPDARGQHRDLPGTVQGFQNTESATGTEALVVIRLSTGQQILARLAKPFRCRIGNEIVVTETVMRVGRNYRIRRGMGCA